VLSLRGRVKPGNRYRVVSAGPSVSLVKWFEEI